jgi:tetratricopeptide (TPR) repeat protein
VAPSSPVSLDLDDLMATPDPDVPAPRRQPATPRSASEPLADLPAPKRVVTPVKGRPLTDLPAPRPSGGRALSDLPVPASASSLDDLPAPKTPHADLGLSLEPELDLPAPKQGLDLPAPKGFFDDLPQPTQKPAATRGTADVPAPKGFFDDLPQPTQKPAATRGTADVPAPKGFFDDLPQPARAHSDSRGIAIDLAGDGPLDTLELALDAPGSSVGGDVRIDAPADVDLSLDGPGLELEPSTASSSDSFDELDLSAPTTGPSSRTPAAPPPDVSARSAIRFDKPKATAGAPSGARPSMPSLTSKHANAELALELEEPRNVAAPARAIATPKPSGSDKRAAKSMSKGKRTAIAGALLGLAVLGSGGHFMYRRHVAAQERADQIQEQLLIARKALAGDDANRWQRAATAASNVLELDPRHAEALGIGAEATIAGALAGGKNATARIARGSQMISDALGAGVTGPALERAQALSSLTSAPDKAAPRLQELVNRDPKDGLLALYLGWAHAAAGNAPAAVKAYDLAIASTPSVKVLALLGRAKTNMELANIEAARADYNAVLEIQKDQIAAQVGLASTLPQSQSQQQESDLLAILERKDIVGADPRAVVQAWVLAGDVARRGGRLDAARERYRKALAIEVKDVAAMTGLAEVELRDNKIEIALEQVTKALTHARDDVRAQLVASEIEIHKGKLDVAKQRVEALSARTPPLPPMDQARLELVRGRLLERQGEHDKAVDAFVAAAKLAGDFDLTPMMAAVGKLGELATQAATAKEVEREAALRARAAQLLGSLVDNAQKDPSLALTLGIAYQQAGDPAKAEPLLRRVLETRASDPDALYQLGKVLRTLARGEEAVEQLKKARAAAPERAEIGLELARTYEALGRDPDADQLYLKLLEAADPSIELRAYAGRYFVRTGQMDRAGEQGDRILTADRAHAAGHYLKAEGLLAAGKHDDARKEFTEAVTLERDPLFLDGQGRATEKLSVERNNDLALQDAALRAYMAAIESDPKLFTSLVGQGRLYVVRREMAKAVPPLLAAFKLRANDPEVALLLGAAYQGTGQKKVAVGWLKRSYELRARAETAYRLGQLYQDPDINQPGPAAHAYGNAARLALEEMKKDGTAQPAWYSDALFFHGRLSLDDGNEAAAKRAWEQWLGLKPPPAPGARRSEVERELATRLRNIR